MPQASCIPWCSSWSPGAESGRSDHIRVTYLSSLQKCSLPLAVFPFGWNLVYLMGCLPALSVHIHNKPVRRRETQGKARAMAELETAWLCVTDLSSKLLGLLFNSQTIKIKSIPLRGSAINRSCFSVFFFTPLQCK